MRGAAGWAPLWVGVGFVPSERTSQFGLQLASRWAVQGERGPGQQHAGLLVARSVVRQCCSERVAAA